MKRATLLRILFLLLACSATLPHSAAAPPVKLYSIPDEVSSKHFVVTINGKTTPVLHAVVGYYLLNFETAGPAKLSVTASDAHYWDAGVEVQPMRLGIRPKRDGATISFRIPGPVKLSITRPGDHFAESEMLFLFANPPETSVITERTPGVRYYAPGVHRESLNPQSGETIYLAGGAVIFGALNLWQVHDVRVLGRGTIIYDGPQNPNNDEGWMHKPDWHAIVMDNARNIEIEGVTCIVRSRTWMVQMRDSRGVKFRNIKVIGGNTGNANQDGMDWLGGGDTLVQDSFFRAADDVFAMQGNWDGYDKKLMMVPGHEVSNIVIEGSVLSTSISNIVRLGWPTKTFDSHNFTLRDSDVIHMGVGGCGVPFALFEIWADPGGHGQHSDDHFENIRLEDWYSLVQLRQPNPAVRNVSFKDIWALDGPGMTPSVLKGDVAGVSFDGVSTGAGIVTDNAGVPIDVVENAEAPGYHTALLDAAFDYSPGLLGPKKKITFKAVGPASGGLHYHWILGDGAVADGREIRHAFPDSAGTLLDGSGRFRVLLYVSDDAGHKAWSSRSVVIASQLQEPLPEPTGPAATPPLTSADKYQRYIRVPADGGYTFRLLTSREASLAVDDLPPAHSQKAHEQVCGSPGNAVQSIRLSVALRAGWHRISVVRSGEIENAASPEGSPGAPLLFWEGPALPPGSHAIPSASN